MEDVVVQRGAKVYTSILDSDVVVKSGATIGVEGAGKDNILVIAKGTVIDKEEGRA